MRVISMQSRDVWEILKENRVYRPNGNMAREYSHYEYEEKILGSHPIWCYARPCIDFATICNGTLLETLRCEMSMDQDAAWKGFVLFELEVPITRLTHGVTHNADPWCYVFAELYWEYLVAVYDVADNPDEEFGWYYKILKPVFLIDGYTHITDSTLDCMYWNNHMDLTPATCFEDGYEDRCVNCGKTTSKYYRGKPICSLTCANKNVDQLCRWANLNRVDVEYLSDAYTRACKSELISGVRSFCDTMKWR